MFELSVHFKIELALILIVSTAHTLGSIVAIWAAISSRHWLFRVTLLGLFILLFLPIGFHVLPTGYYYDVISFVSLYVSLTACFVAVGRFVGRKARNSRATNAATSLRLWFRLSDLMWLTVVIGLTLGLFRLPMQSENLPSWVMVTFTGIATSAATSTGAWLVLGHSKIGWRLVSFVLSTTLATFVWCNYDWYGVAYCFHDYVGVPSRLPSTIIIVGVFWIMLARIAGIPKSWPQLSDRWPKLKWLKLPVLGLLLVLGTFAIVLTGWVYSAMIQPPPAREPLLANPNGYDDLLVAVYAFDGEVSLVGFSSEQEISDFVKNNSKTLEAFRPKLDLAWQVPLDYTDNDTIQLLRHVRKMARGLESYAHVARLDGRITDSARCSLDCIRLGEQSTRGGLTVHFCTGTAAEEMGLKNLRTVLPDLSLDLCREAIETLERTDASHRPFDEFLRRDHVWYQRSGGSVVAFMRCIDQIVGEDRFDNSATLWQICARRDSTLRRLILDLAIQAYGEENNKEPGSLNDLIPTYMSEIPIDPYTEQPFSYSNDDNGLFTRE